MEIVNELVRALFLFGGVVWTSNLQYVSSRSWQWWAFAVIAVGSFYMGITWEGKQ